MELIGNIPSNRAVKAINQDKGLTQVISGNRHGHALVAINRPINRLFSLVFENLLNIQLVYDYL
jgi:hypothetical protein